jgi:hypothetical protein
MAEYRNSKTIIDATKKQRAENKKKLSEKLEIELASRYGFEIYWQGDEDKLICPDKTMGHVVFMQYLYEAKRKLNWLLQIKEQGYWAPDDHGDPWTETCKKHKKGHKRQPAQTDPKDKTNSKKGAAIHGTHGKGSYYDSPTFSQVLKIDAYLRCKCEDDRLIETRYFFFRSFNNAKHVKDGQNLKEYPTSKAAIKEGDDWAIRGKLPKSQYK